MKIRKENAGKMQTDNSADDNDGVFPINQPEGNVEGRRFRVQISCATDTLFAERNTITSAPRSYITPVRPTRYFNCRPSKRFRRVWSLEFPFVHQQKLTVTTYRTIIKHRPSPPPPSFLRRNASREFANVWRLIVDRRNRYENTAVQGVPLPLPPPDRHFIRANSKTIFTYAKYSEINSNTKWHTFRLIKIKSLSHAVSLLKNAPDTLFQTTSHLCVKPYY